ncbi:hypothetical protein VPNG_00067 [Cytospora leucostoma]|uniref:Myb-like domain-containing protein n=1 Tax=Cytospora leucostoma TaxID=1230097 RepID=A0A423XNG0_9PEZI|nr:hypothetical protein VPNG_00067 [Cytospora leucostoma]
MLLPSAISCDPSQPRLQSALFISPPASPPQLSTQTAIGNLINSCRNLHNLIASPVPNEPVAGANTQLPSPPLINMPSPLSRPRLRRRKAAPGPLPLAQTEVPRCRIKRRTPPRGVNKRRRALDDDMDRDDEESSDAYQQKENINIFENASQNKKEDGVFIFRGYTNNASSSSQQQVAPSTPKRRRIAPPDVPRGLTREDFHKLGPSADTTEEEEETTAAGAEGANAEAGRHGDKWSTEDDQLLVEVVLEKVKNIDLSSEVWDDCVRNLPGKDHDSVSSRWESLLKSDSIGLQDKGRSSRGKLHGTW